MFVFCVFISFFFFFFFNDTATTEIYTLSLHDALPICAGWALKAVGPHLSRSYSWRSEEHTSELQSHHDIVCRLLLEKKKKKKINEIKMKKKERKDKKHKHDTEN